MAGLLGDVLPFLYSQGDRAKRWVGGLLSDPAGMATREVNHANDRAGGLLALTSAAAKEGMTNGPASQRLMQVLADAYNPVAATVWHGTPHKFNKFDSSKIGTGEGAQAYGHGLYFAESPAVAQTYKDLNPTALSSPIRAFKGTELTPGTPEYHAATLLDGMGLQQARKQVSGWIANARPEMAREAEGWAKTLETLNAATSKADFKQLKNKGNLYKVDLPDPAIARMLDWDAPLSQQAPEVMRWAQREDVRALHQMTNKGLSQATGADLYRNITATLNQKKTGELPSQMFQNNRLAGASDASDALRQIGIPGIRYLDGGSRGAGTGTRNYVVFPGNESLLTILERNGMPLP